MKIKKWMLCILGFAVAAGASASLRVVSYNIYHGEGADKVADLTLAELKQYCLRDINGKLTDEKIPALEEAMEALRGKCLINFDKSEHNLEMCIAIAKRLDMENQVVMKGLKDPAKVKAVWDASGSKAYYGPIIFNKNSSDNEKAFAKYKQSIEIFEPEMVELVFYREDSSLISTEARKLADEHDVRAWINSLFDKLVDRQVAHGAGIIQSDESFALLEYLRSKGLHD